MKVIKFLAAMFVVALIAAFLFNYQSFSNKDYKKKEAGFCANCHEMKPNYYTWLVTSHNQFGCLKCHKDIKITTFAYKHWRGAMANPIEKRNIIPDDVCKSCHTTARNVSPPGDIIFPHQLHVIKQIDCVDCHSNVTHLHVSQYIKDEYINKQKEFIPATFNEQQAAKLIKKGNQILMPVCLRCHNGDMATGACKACHKNIKSADKIIVKG